MVHMICSHQHDLALLMKLLPQKYPQMDINYYHMVKSLSYFDDAEREPLPKMHISANWADVKDYFRAEQKKLLQGLTAS